MKKMQVAYFIMSALSLFLYPSAAPYYPFQSSCNFTFQNQSQTFFDNARFSVSLAPINARRFVYQQPIIFLKPVELMQQPSIPQPSMQNQALEQEQKRIKEAEAAAQKERERQQREIEEKLAQQKRAEEQKKKEEERRKILEEKERKRKEQWLEDQKNQAFINLESSLYKNYQLMHDNETEKEELYKLGAHFLTQAIEQHNQKNQLLENHYFKRAQAIAQNSLSKHLHEELTQTLEKTAAVVKEYPNDHQIQHNATVIYAMAECAEQQQQDPEIAFHLADFCHHFQQATEEMSKLIARSQEIPELLDVGNPPSLQKARDAFAQAVARCWNNKYRREKTIEKLACKEVNLGQRVETTPLQMLSSIQQDIHPEGSTKFILENPELTRYQKKFYQRLRTRVKQIHTLQKNFRNALQTSKWDNAFDEHQADMLPVKNDTFYAHQTKQATLKKELEAAYEPHAEKVHEKQLYQLAHRYLAEADNAYEQNDLFFTQRHQQRCTAIIETLKNPENTTSKTIVHDSNCKFEFGGMCEKNFFDKEIFSTYKNAPLSRLLHTELKDSLLHTTQLIQEYPDSPYTHGNAVVIYHAAASAKLEKNNERAFLLSDFCHQLTQATAGLGALGTGIRCVGFFGSGWVDGIFYNLKAWKDRPIETACLAIMGPLKAAAFLLAQASFVYVTDREKFYAKCRQLNAARQNAQVEHACYLLGYFLGPGLTKLCAGKMAKSLKRSFINNRFYRVLQQQKEIQAVVSGVGTFSTNVKKAVQPIQTIVQRASDQVNQAGKAIANAGKKVVQEATVKLAEPVRQILYDSNEMLKLCAEQGVKNVQEVMDLVKKSIALTVKEKIDLCKAEEVFASLKGKMPPIDLEHIFSGTIYKKRLHGLHHIKQVVNGNYKTIIPPDNLGIFKIEYSLGKLKKISTCFPSQWNESKVIEKIYEAFNNVTHTGDFMIKGLTSEGVKIKICFGKIPSTGEIIITSAYPLLEP